MSFDYVGLNTHMQHDVQIRHIQAEEHIFSLIFGRPPDRLR